jgi:Domain of unknown function (DUF4430)
VSRRLLAALSTGLALGLAGCGFGPGQAEQTPTELHVTRDFGQKELGLPATRDELRPSDTVMRFLAAEHNITTRFGGGFVQSIDGLQGNRDAEHDWFFYVNGSESSKGAAEYELNPSDVVQWDYHRWTATQHIPAIVGAFPEPFVHGLEGRRLPTRVECSDADDRACDAVLDALGRHDVPTSSSTLGAAPGEHSLRVIVGPWDELKATFPAERIQRGPSASGVFARFSDDGDLTLLDGTGEPSREAPEGSGLVAATELEGEGPVWLITGKDDAAVERAAAALDEDKLRNRFAVAATPTGIVPLPEGGR